MSKTFHLKVCLQLHQIRCDFLYESVVGFKTVDVNYVTFLKTVLKCFGRQLIRIKIVWVRTLWKKFLSKTYVENLMMFCAKTNWTKIAFSVKQILLPTKMGRIPQSAFSNDATSKLAGLFSTLSL